MTAYYLDWLNLLFRWLHVITAIAWIGSSFYFVWLDNSLEAPEPENKKKGFGGQLSSIHAGGFYEIGKYSLSPAVLPANLHWFKWEAYSTWMTGFFLFVLMFYVGAESYLVDSSKNNLSANIAILISLTTIFGGWFFYDALCKSPLSKTVWILGFILLCFIGGLSWGLGKLISDRAAYLHIGALIGTCMAGNVFRIIMPGQRAMVAAIEAGDSPDPKYARASKLRSIHNNYMTLPVIFIMVSNHYPMTYSHTHGWAILVAIIIIGAWARHFFNLRHKGITKPSILISATLALAFLAWLTSPPVPSVISATGVTNPGVSDAKALSIVHSRCSSCHAQQNTDPLFSVAQAGVMLETIEQIKQWGPRIKARAILTNDMPFMNKTNMTALEREQLGLWLNQQNAR